MGKIELLFQSLLEEKNTVKKIKPKFKIGGGYHFLLSQVLRDIVMYADRPMSFSEIVKELETYYEPNPVPFTDQDVAKQLNTFERTKKSGWTKTQKGGVIVWEFNHEDTYSEE